MDMAAQCVVDVGPNLLTVLMAIISTSAAVFAAIHASKANRSSVAAGVAVDALGK